MAKTGITINQAGGGCLATWKMAPQEFYIRLDLCKNSGNSQNIVESLYYLGGRGKVVVLSIFFS